MIAHNSNSVKSSKANSPFYTKSYAAEHNILNESDVTQEHAEALDRACQESSKIIDAQTARRRRILTEIFETRAYRLLGFDSIEAYTWTRFDRAKAWTYREIQATRFERVLIDNDVITLEYALCTSVLITAFRVESRHRNTVLRQAIEEARATGGRLTAPLICQIAERNGWLLPKAVNIRTVKVKQLEFVYDADSLGHLQTSFTIINERDGGTETGEGVFPVKAFLAQLPWEVIEAEYEARKSDRK